MAAYAFSCTQFRGRKTLMTLTVISIMIPGQILIVPLFKEMSSFGMVDTFAGVILPQIVAPVMVFILKNFFDAIPAELLDAARVDGAGPWRMFVRIVLPLSSSVLVAVAIFVFIGAWNNFLWPFIVTNDPSLMTLPVGLSTVKDAYGVQYAQTMASAVIAALPLLLIFMFFQRKIVQSFATTGLGGQ
jgi:multiple sugar transport system permease protein